MYILGISCFYHESAAALIKDGEISSPIRSMMISGNIFDVLKNMDGAGKDVRKIGNIITPTIRVSKMRIVG